jgi:class 3 adenylate cyclase
VRGFRGTLVDSTGDGMLARFDGPARAIRCAAALVAGARAIGLEVRAGVHVGEVEITGSTLRGAAVHETGRISAEAAPGEVLVSEITRVLSAQAGMAFEDAGEHRLKGFEEPRRLYRFSGE